MPRVMEKYSPPSVPLEMGNQSGDGKKEEQIRFVSKQNVEELLNLE